MEGALCLGWGRATTPVSWYAFALSCLTSSLSAVALGEYAATVHHSRLRWQSLHGPVMGGAVKLSLSCACCYRTACSAAWCC